MMSTEAWPSPNPAFEKARTLLYQRCVIHHESRDFVVALLLREEDWRPLDAPWWRTKQVYAIGTDLDGNFFLKHSSGAISAWIHSLQIDVALAKSTTDFARMLVEQ